MMKRSALLLTALAAACAPPAAPLPEPPRTVAVVAPAAPDVQDEDFRYRPPAIEPAPAEPAPIEIALAGGARALVLERHGTPLVAVDVAFRADRAPALARLETMAATLLQRGPLGDVLAGGVRVEAGIDHLTASFAVHAGDLEATLRAVVDAITAGPRDEAAFAQEKERAIAAARKPYPAMEALLAWRFPAGHPYHVDVMGEQEVARRVRLADVRRYLSEVVRRDAVTFCVVGDVSPTALRPVLDRAASTLRGGPGAAPRPVAPPKGGLVYVDGASRQRAAFRVIAPLPTHDAGNVAAEMAADIVAHALLAGRQPWDRAPVAEGTSDWKNVSASRENWRLSAALTVGANVAADRVGEAIERVLAETARVARGEISEQELLVARFAAEDPLARIGRVQADDAAANLALLAYYGATPATAVARRRAAEVASADDVKAAAATFLRKEAMQFWVDGDERALQQLTALKIAPLAVRRAPRTEGTPR
jgi:predicted Zn-dependent peptidase